VKLNQKLRGQASLQQGGENLPQPALRWHYVGHRQKQSGRTAAALTQAVRDTDLNSIGRVWRPLLAGATQ
jgi:hypothetical protein